MSGISDIYLKVRFDEVPIREDRYDPLSYVTKVEARIIRMVNEDKHVLVGKIAALLVDAFGAEEARVSLDDVFDCMDQPLRNCYEAIFDPETGNYRRNLSQERDEYFNGANLLLISTVEILPRYRGKGYGRPAIRQLMKLLRGGAAMTALEALPVSYDYPSVPGDSTWQSRMEVDEFEEKTEEGTKKLRRYWEGLGFKHIQGTDVLSFNLAYNLPPLKDLLKGK